MPYSRDHIGVSNVINQSNSLAPPTITKSIHKITDTRGANWPGDRTETCSPYNFSLATGYIYLFIYLLFNRTQGTGYSTK